MACVPPCSFEKSFEILQCPVADEVLTGVALTAAELGGAELLHSRVECGHEFEITATFYSGEDEVPPCTAF